MENTAFMKKEPIPQDVRRLVAADFRRWARAPVMGQVLSILFGLLFLFQCMILPLVGKAAMGGSGRRGRAGRHRLENPGYFSSRCCS